MRFSGSPPKLFCFFAFSAKKQLTAARFRDKLVLPLKGFIFLCSFLKVFPCPRGRQTNSVNQEVPKNESENHLGLHGVQTAQLQHDEKQEKRSGQT